MKLLSGITKNTIAEVKEEGCITVSATAAEEVKVKAEAKEKVKGKQKKK